MKGQQLRRVTVKCNHPGCNTYVTCGINAAFRAICPEHYKMRQNSYKNDVNRAKREGRLYKRVPTSGVACRICGKRFVKGLCGCD